MHDQNISSQYQSRGPLDIPFTLSFFLIILLSGSVQLYDIRILAIINSALQLWLLFKVRFTVSKSLKPVILIFSVFLIYSIAITGFNNDLVYVFYRYYDFMAAFLLLNYFLIKNPNFNKTFYLVMLGLLVHGLLGFVLANLFLGFFSPIKEGDVIIHTLLGIFFAPEASTYLGLQRSQSFFWEPGVYQIYLNVFLFYVCFCRQKISIIPLILLGIISTFSTTGLVIALFQITILFYKKLKISLSGIVWFFIAIVTLVYFTQITYSNVEDKIIGDGSTGSIGSSLARQFDTINGIQVAFNNPLGIGFSPIKYQAIAEQNLYNVETLLNTNRGQTNGVVELLYTSGFIFWLVFIYYFLKQKVFLNKRWVFNIIFLLCMLTEPLVFSPFFFFFVISGMENSRKLIL